MDAKKIEKERDEFLEGWQRAKADYANLKKQEEARREEIVRFANESLITEILEISDLFDIAFSHKDSWEKVDESWRKGVESIHQRFLSLLEKHGLEKIETKEGDKFDPEIHLSIGSEETESDDKDETIQSVVQSGYKLSAKVIRPSKVKIWQKS